MLVANLASTNGAELQIDMVENLRELRDFVLEHYGSENTVTVELVIDNADHDLSMVFLNAHNGRKLVLNVQNMETVYTVKENQKIREMDLES